MSGPDVFISYNREDAAIAKTYADGFAAAGLEVWWDATLKSGEAYDEVTESALREARAVVVLWSPRSVVSRWVRAEATIAERNKTLMPVTIEPCERPVMFELTQTAELTHWRGETEDKGWLAFLKDVQRKVGRDSPRPAAAQPARASAKSAASARNGPAFVGLLPISYRGSDEELELLAEDLTEEITRELSQNGWFMMIAERKMAAFRGKSVDYVELGRELDAPYLIDGKLQRSGENVRLTMQLIDTATGSMLHSARSSRKLDEITDAVEEFAISLGADTGDRIVQHETKRALNKSGQRTGWEHLLVAKSAEGGAGSEAMHRTLEAARAAIAVAPDLGMAHAMLANSLAIQVAAHGLKLTDAIRQEMKTHAASAQQLDQENPIVLDFLIVVYATLYEDEVSLNLARRLVNIRPNSPKSYHRLLISLVSLGRTGEALVAYQDFARVVRSSNLWPVAHIYAGMSYYLEGQMAEAQAALDLALGIYPGYFLALKWKAIVAAADGDEQAGIALIRRIQDIEPAMTLDMHVGQILHNPNLAERSAEAVAILSRLWNATEARSAA